jgi:hypothetical protein
MASPPRADEAPCVVSASEDDDVHGPGVRADGPPAALAIVPAGVLGLEDGASEDRGGHSEIHLVLGDVLLALRFVPLVPHT